MALADAVPAADSYSACTHVPRGTCTRGGYIRLLILQQRRRRYSPLVARSVDTEVVERRRVGRWPRKSLRVSRAAYEAALAKFDTAICEAIAVSQASSGRLPAINVGYASHVFTRMCGAGISLIRAVPLSRWVLADFDDWQFGAVAGHARSLLDGFLLFNYLIEPAKSEAELKARINVMHLNDCTRRIELHTNLGFTQDLEGFENQRDKLRVRLNGNEYFKSLPAPVQKNCLNGRFLMIDTRDEILAKVDFEKGQYGALYDLWSQHVHILPISFYRMEANGRGTGSRTIRTAPTSRRLWKSGERSSPKQRTKWWSNSPRRRASERGLSRRSAPAPRRTYRKSQNRMAEHTVFPAKGWPQLAR